MTGKKRESEDGCFAGIHGQPVPTTTLANLVESDRLPGTLLFSGPSGVGKLATALALAKGLHCENGSAHCECSSCRAIRTGSHPDVIVLSRDRQLRVDEMREIVSLASLRASETRERVIIIDRAEEITPAASNAALKTLEEPGKHVRFILIADRPAALLPTVRSRAYKVRFGLLSAVALKGFAEAVGDDPEDEMTSAALSVSGGRPGDYLRWRHCEEYRDVAGEARAWLRETRSSSRSPSLKDALRWKDEFWELAERLTAAQRRMRLPRGGDASEIGSHFADPAGYPVAPINWRVEEESSGQRWSQGRKALLFAGLLRRTAALGSGAEKARVVTRLQDFMQKIRFNCSFDIALERLYFSIVGRADRAVL